LKNSPERRMDSTDKQQNSYDGTHRDKTNEGRVVGTRTCPLGSTADGNVKDSTATSFHNWYDAVAL
jgi:hypothetical protein